MDSSKQHLYADNVTFWAERWSNKETGWHMNQLNPAIQKFGEQWLGKQPKNAKVMFPLCGKTQDLKILNEQGYETFGIEGVMAAVDDYVAENKVALTEKEPHANLKTFDVGGPTIYFGDFFAWDLTTPAAIHSVFDRGSLVAILPSKRKEYFQVINSMLLPGGTWMIASMAYNQEEKPGAPHSISPDDVKALLEELKETDPNASYTIEVLAEINPLNAPDHPMAVSRFLKKNGGPLENFIDYVILLTKQ